MNEVEIESSVGYLTNSVGEKTAVIVPLDVWRKLLAILEKEGVQETSPTETARGLHPLDEQEPIAQILEDLQTSVREARSGQTRPVSQLWDGID